MSSKQFYPFKDFQSNQIQGSARKIFTAHYACRDADMNLTPVTGTTNGFIFQMINSLIELWGQRLMCLDCKSKSELTWSQNRVDAILSTKIKSLLRVSQKRRLTRIIKIKIKSVGVTYLSPSILFFLTNSWLRYTSRYISRIFVRRGCTRLLLYFNTNKPHCRIPVVLENRSSSQEGGGCTPCTLPLDPPLIWR